MEFPQPDTHRRTCPLSSPHLCSPVETELGLQGSVCGFLQPTVCFSTYTDADAEVLGGGSGDWTGPRVQAPALPTPWSCLPRAFSGAASTTPGLASQVSSCLFPVLLGSSQISERHCFLCGLGRLSYFLVWMPEPRASCILHPGSLGWSGEVP